MSNTLLVGTRKGLFTLVRGISGWAIEHVDFLGENISMLLDDPRDETLYAVLTLGHFGTKLRRKGTGETEWTEVGVPVYPPDAEYGMGHFAPADGPKSRPASLKEIWALEVGGPDQPGQLWAGTIPGGLFRSPDRGDTWELNESLWNQPQRMEWVGGGKDDPGIHSVCVDPRDSQHVTLGVSCGGVWETRDGGSTWENIGQGLRSDYSPPGMEYDRAFQDAHRLACSAADPDTMWVQHHNGIFHSTDGAHSFDEIKQAGPSVFGFAVVAHPHDPKTAWFVPGVKDECRIPVNAQLAVTRTRDGGQSFDTLRNGLPQQHCYDIVFRHGLDIDASGNQLAMGSSTGGLWITENGGDHWQEISTTLPQVYCVRFRRW